MRVLPALLGLLRSQRLALVLLLGAATVAAAGTWLSALASNSGAGGAEGPGARPGLGLMATLAGPLLTVLLALSAVNVTFCTVHRRLGKRVQTGLSFRGGTDLALHLSIVLVLAGGASKAALGFVGTQHVYQGTGTATVYEWRAGRDVPLGFELQVEDFREEHYPARVRVGIRNAGTGEKVALVELVEGLPLRVQGTGLDAIVEGYDPLPGTLRISVSKGGEREVLTFGTDEGSPGERDFAGYRLSLVAWRADVRTVAARVALLENGVRVSEGVLKPNSRLAHRGTSLYLTAWGRDRFGNPFCGIQAVRDPGAPVFWLGCVLLALAVPAHLIAKGLRPRVPGAGPDSAPG